MSLQLERIANINAVILFGAKSRTFFEKACFNQIWTKSLNHVQPNPRCVGIHKIWITTSNKLIARVIRHIDQAFQAKEFRKMRGHLIVPLICISPVEERLVEGQKIDRGDRFPPSFVKVVVQDDNSAAGLCRVLHIPNRPLWLADPLDRPGGGYDVEPVMKLLVERQDIRGPKVQVFQSGILSGRAGNVSVVAIDTQRHTVLAHCSCDVSRDRSCAATNVEDVHPGAQESREMAMVSLQSASVQDSCVGAMRLLAHLPLHDAIDAVPTHASETWQGICANAEPERIIGNSEVAQFPITAVKRRYWKLAIPQARAGFGRRGSEPDRNRSLVRTATTNRLGGPSGAF